MDTPVPHIELDGRDAQEYLSGYDSLFREPTEVDEHHDLPGGPIAVDSEKAMPGERVDDGRAPVRVVSNDPRELERDYTMFTFGPVYAGTGFKYDVVYQFGSALQLDRVPNVISCNSPTPFFSGMGRWDNCLQGVPVKYGDLFHKFVLGLVIPDSVARPQRYWRVDEFILDVYTPGAVTLPMSVRVYCPSGMDYRIEPELANDYTYHFLKKPPRDWVVEEARRYFLAQ